MYILKCMNVLREDLEIFLYRYNKSLFHAFEFKTII